MLPVLIWGPMRRAALFRKLGTELALCSVDPKDEWLPNLVNDLCVFLSQYIGKRIALIRFVVVEKVSLAEAEIVDSPEQLGESFTWLTLKDAVTRPEVIPRDRALLKLWCRRVRDDADGLTPWEIPGWYYVARDWIDCRLGEHGVGRAGGIKQIKAGWSESCVFEVPTTDGNCYFKAGRTSDFEARLLLAMAAEFPTRVPSIITADADRNWMLLRDFGGRPLNIRSTAECQELVRDYAELQLAMAGKIPSWRWAGCPYRKLQTMAVQFGELIEPLPPAYAHLERGPDRTALLHLVKRIEGLASRIEQFGIPDSLVNRDMAPTNCRVVPSGFLYFDWANSVLAHPFFGIVHFLQSLIAERERLCEYNHSAACQDIVPLCDSYLRPWREFARLEDLNACFKLIRELNNVFQATRWHEELVRNNPFLVWTVTVAGNRASCLSNCHAEIGCMQP